MGYHAVGFSIAMGTDFAKRMKVFGVLCLYSIRVIVCHGWVVCVSAGRECLESSR